MTTRVRHHPVYLEIIHRLAPLIQQHQPLSKLSFPDLCDHLSFYWNRGTMSYSIDNYGEPQGVCLIKLFSRMEEFLYPYIHWPCGKFVMIELLVATHPLAMAKCFEDLVHRWGPQDVVLWDRGERTEFGTPRMYRWNQFEKLARRLTYGAIEKV